MTTQSLSPPSHTEVEPMPLQERFMGLQNLTGHLPAERRIMLCHSALMLVHDREGRGEGDKDRGGDESMKQRK